MGWGGADNTPSAEVETSRDSGRDNEPWHGIATRYPLHDDPTGPSATVQVARAKAATVALEHFPLVHTSGVRCACGQWFLYNEHRDPRGAWALHYAAALIPDTGGRHA